MAEITKKPVKITETILRDAHQSQAATRMRLEEMLPACALLDKAGYFAISAGHDHRNAFVGSVPVGTDGDRQMMMVASPTSGFGSYGPVPAKRAARLFEFDIRHPYEPRTQLLEYDELVGKPSVGKAYAYGMTSESKPDSEGMDLLHRPTWWSKTWNKLVSLFRK